MHLIPESWAHLHILVSVFPSCGLIFALGFYAAAFATNNEALKRTCLVAFGVLGLLAVPTYLSGDGAMEALAQRPKFSEDMVSAHYGWSIAALGVLALTGIAAWIALFRFRGATRVSDNALHLVLGLALVTLGLMAVVGELGWEINHTEIFLPTQKTPQIWSHVHIMLNHLPTVGFVFALAFYATALVLKNVVMTRASLVLFVICAVLGVPTFVTGNASMWALTEPPVTGISKAVINAHRDFALYSLFALAFTGVAAWIQLWRFRPLRQFFTPWLFALLIFSVLTLRLL